MIKTTDASLLSSAAHAFYENHSVAEDMRSQLEETAIFLISVTRRSTEETFKLGEHLERAAGLLPEGTLEKWAVERCGYTARHVRTQRAVFRNLGRYKEILVALAVGPTVLGKLSVAKPEQIEQAIGFATEHNKLRVQDVAAIMAGSKNEDGAKPNVDPYDVGGIDGLNAIIAIKVRDGLKSFVRHIKGIGTEVTEALTKKTIVKKALADQIHLTARLAQRELESLTQFVMPNPNAAYSIWPSPLPTKSRWAEVSSLLYKMGSADSWPDKANLRTWLETEVVPVLEWAISTTSAPAWPGDEANTSPSVNVQIGVDESAPAEVTGSHNPVADRSSTDDGLEVPIALSDANDIAEPAAPVASEDSVPTVDEALAKPERRFQRPAFMDKIKPAPGDRANPTIPPSAAA